ncbi:hypothetical protein ACFQZS_02630 [Mucilaginibacter calamicampi]|uniref:Phage protein n=1 Tax=Mucilaginibacter calamicampi TaxID=1302352 RepID=A0ABW2YT38_9SPHI
MADHITFKLYRDSDIHTITITEVKEVIPGKSAISGVFKLTEGKTNLGNIVFDDAMNQWEYTALGDLTHKEAAIVATYIKDKIKAQSV